MLLPLLLAVAQAPAADAAPKPIESLPPLVENAQAVSPDHKRIAVSTKDEGVWVIDIATGNIAFRTPPSEFEVVCATWNADGSALALLRRDARVDLVDGSTGELRSTQQSTAFEVKAWPRRTVQFAGHDRVLVVALGGCPADLLPTDGGEIIAHISGSGASDTTALAMSPDSELLALGNDEGIVTLWNSRTGKQVPGEVTTPFCEPSFRGIHSLDFHPSGHLLAIGSGDCKVRLWKFESKDPMRELSHCDADLFGLGIGCVKFSPDGSRLLASSFKYFEFRVWDVASGTVKERFDFGGGYLRPLKGWFTSDGKFFITELACRVAPADGRGVINSSPSKGGDRPLPGGWPLESEAVLYQFAHDLAWAVVDHHLIVRKIPDEQPILKIAVREK